MLDLKKALDHLAKDPIMAVLIKTYPINVWDETPRDFFPDMVENIIGQQLSLKAADTITNRFKELFGGRFPTPDQIVATPDDVIRSCGVSWAKAKYLKNLSQAVIDNTLPIDKFSEMSDEAIKTSLVKIKGIGNWTAEMMLMFTLRRVDVFSPGDGGLQNAMAKHYKVKPGDLKVMTQLAIAWSPYRSIACKILWKSLDIK